MNTPSFVATLNQILSERGFSRRSRREWLREFGDGFILIDLQKSRYDKAVFLNFHIALKAFLKAQQPEDVEFIASGRDPGIDADKVRLLGSLLSSPEDIPVDPGRRMRLVGIIEEIVRGLEPLCTEEGLKKRIESQPPLAMYVKTKLLFRE